MYLKRLHKDGKCTGVRVLHTGTSPAQNFSTRLVTQAAAEGWLSISGDALTLRAENGDFRYRVLRQPGKHPADNHCGYEVINCYECVLDAATHAKHKAGANSPEVIRGAKTEPGLLARIVSKLTGAGNG